MDNSISQKTLLLLIPHVGFGGAERVFYDHSVELGKKFNVIECVFNDVGNQAYISGNKFISLDVPGGGGPLAKIKNFILRCIRLKAIKKQYQVDTCISHLEGADYINLLTKGHEKVILCIHGSKIHDKNIAGFVGWIRKKILMPILYNRADTIVTVSKDINAELIDSFGVMSSKILTINNFFDINQIRQASSEELGIEYQTFFQENVTLITSGRLASQKNQLPMIEVFASLKLIKPNVKLVILGDGELRDTLVQASENYGLKVFKAWDKYSFSSEYDVFFLGYQSNPFKFLSQADVFVFPSAWEGFPMALSEAMICGLPVISTDCPTGPREILSPVTILEKPLENPEFAPFGILMPMLLQTSPRYTEVKHIWVDLLNKVLNESQMLEYYKTQSQLRMQDFSKEKIVSKWEALLN